MSKVLVERIKSETKMNTPTGIADGSEPMLEVFAEGNVFRVYADGRLEGFPPDAFVLNFVPAVIRPLRFAAAVSRGDMTCIH